MPYSYAYPRPAVTADAVVFSTAPDGVQVLLIQRGQPPCEGAWALPGGFVDMDEELEAAARRELREETGLDLPAMQQVGAFGGVDRDPRGRVISIAFTTTIGRDAQQPVAADDARDVRWFALSALPALAFDHEDVIAQARSVAGH